MIYHLPQLTSYASSIPLYMYYRIIRGSGYHRSKDLCVAYSIIFLPAAVQSSETVRTYSYKECPERKWWAHHVCLQIEIHTHHGKYIIDLILFNWRLQLNIGLIWSVLKRFDAELERV
jgi:hypothetical protein